MPPSVQPSSAWLPSLVVVAAVVVVVVVVVLDAQAPSAWLLEGARCCVVSVVAVAVVGVVWAAVVVV